MHFNTVDENGFKTSRLKIEPIARYYTCKKNLFSVFLEWLNSSFYFGEIKLSS